MFSVLSYSRRYHFRQLKFLSEAVQDECPGEQLKLSVGKILSLWVLFVFILLFRLGLFSVVDLGS